MRISIQDKGNFFFDVLDNNYKIATVELFVDNKYWLNKITLEGDCRGKKYGPAIIKHLKANYKPFRISLSSKNAHYHISLHPNDTRCLTSDGFRLAKECFQFGILSRQHYELPFEDELLQYKSDRFLENGFSNILNFINTILSRFEDN